MGLVSSLLQAFQNLLERLSTLLNKANKNKQSISHC